MFIRTIQLITSLLLFAASLANAQFGLRNPAFVGNLAPRPAAGGSPAWIDVSTLGASDTSEQSQQDSTYAQQISLGAGQATKFRIYSYDPSFNFAGVVKFALYDSGGNIVGTASDYGSVNITAGNQYFEITFATPPTLTAGTYWLAWNPANGGQTFRYKAGTGAITLNTLAHASFPPATITVSGGTTREYVVSVFAVAP